MILHILFLKLTNHILGHLIEMAIYHQTL
jgi:multisubunit Na+/H+ antiporter MnhG subunit